MALSNTAIPKFYGEFRSAVMRGEILVCETISLEMNRIDSLISNPLYFYDEQPVNGYIAFCESELTLTDGEPLHLLDSFKIWAEQLYGWYYFAKKSVFVKDENGHGRFVDKIVKRRLTKKQFLIVGRGAAKSLYGTTIHAKELTVNHKTTHQVTTAHTMKQAEEIVSPFRTALARAPGPFFKFLTEGSLQNTTGAKKDRVKCAPTKKGIENFLSNSLLEVRPMSIDKLQGLRPFVTTVDEWLSTDTREDVIGAIEQGASKLDDYIIVSMSSEGTVRNGSGDTIKMELTEILNGDYDAPHVSIWWYKLDDVKEVADPNTWIKCNPNLGKTVSYEAYQLDVERMVKAPATRNDILAKRFGIAVEGFTYFFRYEETIPHNKRSYTGMVCAMGSDLSRGDDFCAFTFLFPLKDGSFGIKVKSYISSLTFLKLEPAARVIYDEYIKEGTLTVMEDVVLKMQDVYDDLRAFIISNQYTVLSMGYDPYNADEFVKRWEQDYGPFYINKVIQGAKTESVPLGEIKNYAEQKMIRHDELLMAHAMGNSITILDNNGNRKLVKRRHDQKIDNVAALIDAYVSYKANIDIYY